jgi:hypothetical protein
MEEFCVGVLQCAPEPERIKRLKYAPWNHKSQWQRDYVLAAEYAVHSRRQGDKELRIWRRFCHCGNELEPVYADSSNPLQRKCDAIYQNLHQFSVSGTTLPAGADQP